MFKCAPTRQMGHRNSLCSADAVLLLVRMSSSATGVAPGAAFAWGSWSERAPSGSMSSSSSRDACRSRASEVIGAPARHTGYQTEATDLSAASSSPGSSDACPSRVLIHQSHSRATPYDSHWASLSAISNFDLLEQQGCVPARPLTFIIDVSNPSGLQATMTS